MVEKCKHRPHVCQPGYVTSSSHPFHFRRFCLPQSHPALTDYFTGKRNKRRNSRQSLAGELEDALAPNETLPATPTELEVNACDEASGYITMLPASLSALAEAAREAKKTKAPSPPPPLRGARAVQPADEEKDSLSVPTSNMRAPSPSGSYGNVGASCATSDAEDDAPDGEYMNMASNGQACEAPSGRASVSPLPSPRAVPLPRTKLKGAPPPVAAKPKKAPPPVAARLKKAPPPVAPKLEKAPLPVALKSERGPAPVPKAIVIEDDGQTDDDLASEVREQHSVWRWCKRCRCRVGVGRDEINCPSEDVQLFFFAI